MGISQALFGVNYTVPETPDRNWGAQVTAYNLAIMQALNTGYFSLNSNGVLVLNSTVLALAASATITPARQAHYVASTGGAVTLDATTAIADGSIDGQTLFLFGNSNTNTVEVPNSANTRLNGSVILTLGDCLALQWNDTDSNWWEISRNN